MNNEFIITAAAEYVDVAPENRIGADIALSPEFAGIRIFDRPIFGFASAMDPMFEDLRRPEAVGDCFMPPNEWLDGAKSVISFFLPFTEEIKRSNALDFSEPSALWLHGRIEGHAFLNNLTLFIAEKLRDTGFEAVVPSLDKRFKMFRNYNGLEFTSRWSERHVAYVCGLGTFGLSKGLITEKGIAGRFGSVITTAALEPTGRKYTGIYEYCTMCGSCVHNCPVGAICLETGKDHKKCSDFLDITVEKYRPRYGCGKCQVKVPCQNGIPKK
ncbi:MAG TPA: 4Fe-4S binding protein [Clostridiales bacterium]|jgi:epoxyqueuosine reductase|nr:4Fe-4S binding protein [Clostridiales bacterium]